MNKAFTNFQWENDPSINTPLSAENLNRVNNAVNEIDNRVIGFDTTKANQTDMLTTIVDVKLNESNGVFTFTRKNGTTIELDTKLEKVVVNFSFDAETQILYLNLQDGTKLPIDLSAFITNVEFENTATIRWEKVAGGKMKAYVIGGSITSDMLEPNYLANVQLYASQAMSSANSAKTSAEEAEESAIRAEEAADKATSAVGGDFATNTRVDNIVNGTTPVAKATDADTVDGYHAYQLQEVGSDDAPLSGHYLVFKHNVNGDNRFASVTNTGHEISVNHANYATNADTVDGKHASDFTKSGTLISGTDFNTVTTSGVYRISSGHPNQPSNIYDYGHLLVLNGGNSDTIVQICCSVASEDISVRQKYGNDTEWNPWVRLADHNDLAKYLPLNGSVPMNGALRLDGGYGRLIASFQWASLQSWVVADDFTNGRMLLINNNKHSGNETLEKAMQLRDFVNGVETVYDVLHTGNVGSYALPLDGSKPMSGWLKTANGYAVLGGDSAHANLQARSTIGDDKNYRALRILNDSYESNTENALEFYELVNGIGSSRKVLHSGNVGSYALPISGGTIQNEYSTSTPFYVQNGKLATNSMAFVGYKDKDDSILGYLGFHGKNNPIMYEATGTTTHKLLHTGNSAKVVVSSTPLTAEGSIRVW